MDSQAVHHCYHLKPSRFALGFQLLCLLIMLILIYLTSGIWGAVGCFIIACIGLTFFRKRHNAYKLEQLDYQLWSVQYRSSQKIQHVKIERFIDHTFYIAVNFEDKKLKPFIIWQDQVVEYQWKSLKSRCKF
ncbi:protein YgfX [Acinetobacter piscicola]|uniref:protein YgfX n=1 Tax=Acinetobacter piscicola TaxID=2006115 RepID=UPI000B7D4C32|nr:protein YgfX [Acinetobacter piscicola]